MSINGDIHVTVQMAGTDVTGKWSSAQQLATFILPYAILGITSWESAERTVARTLLTYARPGTVAHMALSWAEGTHVASWSAGTDGAPVKLAD